MRPRRRLRGPETLDILPLGEEEELVAYRITLTDDTGHPDFERSFTSRGELGLPPRRGTAEERHPALADGISMYRTREAAVATARRLIEIDRGVGEYTAEVTLRGGMGITFAEWGPPGHLTIWGEPLTLCEATADIQAVSFPEEVTDDELHDPRQHR